MTVTGFDQPMERLTPEMVDALDIEGLETVEASLVYRMSEIDAQLVIADEFDEGYEDWRRRAVFAKRKMTGQLVLVRHRLKALRRLEHSRPRGNACFDPTDPQSLLAAALDTLKGFVRDLDEVTVEEQSVIDAIGDYLQIHPLEAVA